VRKRLWILAGVILIVVIGLLVRSGIGVRVHSSAETYDLSQAQLVELIKKARNQNDAEAAFRVYQYYNYSSTADNRESNILYYLRIAATNGNTVAQYNLAVNLVLRRDPLKYEEARFWLEKAAAAGHGYAKKGLQDWDHFVSEWQ
jgi:TPR repeat protein